jgi:hypothetical protein
LSLTDGWGKGVVRDDPNSIVHTSRRTQFQTLGTCPA